jgi:hypothetical protein
MTSPEDDGLEETLRRALSGAAGEVEPGADGLDKIRARICNRPPRPWLLSVLVGLLDRVRHWTWRGHWAWPDSLPRLRAPQERRSRRANFPEWGFGWVRFVTVLAGIAVLAGMALAVQPFRHAILQAGSSLNGGGGPPRASTGTEGSGTQAANGGNGGNRTPSTATVASGAGQTSQTRTTASGKTAAPHPTSSARCVSTVLPVVTSAKPSEASAATGAASTASATEVATSPSAGSSVPAEPVYTNSNAPTCPVAAPTRTPTPTPTPTSSSASLDPTPSDVPPTQAPAPTGTDPTPTASGSSPTGDPTSDPTSGDPTSSPWNPTSRSWADRQEERHADLLDRHHRRP